LSLIPVVVFGLFGWAVVSIGLLYLRLPGNWMEFLIVVVTALLCFSVMSAAGYGLWFIWKGVPTLTKKNEELLANWLRDHRYTLCVEPVKLVFRRSFEYLLDKDGYYEASAIKRNGGSIVITSNGNELKFSIDKKEEIPLLDNYTYTLLDGSYMAMFFKHEPRRIQIYKQTP
jgi:hypothetical protein